MSTKQLIEEFFEEQFKETSQFFLYKDKQLLKKGKYREYAEEQLKKANSIFWGFSSSMFLHSGMEPRASSTMGPILHG